MLRLQTERKSFYSITTADQANMVFVGNRSYKQKGIYYNESRTFSRRFWHKNIGGEPSEAKADD